MKNQGRFCLSYMYGPIHGAWEALHIAIEIEDPATRMMWLSEAMRCFVEAGYGREAAEQLLDFIRAHNFLDDTA